MTALAIMYVSGVHVAGYAQLCICTPGQKHIPDASRSDLHHFKTIHRFMLNAMSINLQQRHTPDQLC